MSATGSSNKKRAGRDARRSKLLDAARQVFSQKGYHPATVDDITKVAGVAKGTFYLYFAEKRAVFYDLIQQFFDMVTAVGESVAQDVSTREEYFARWEMAAGRLADLFRQQRDLVRLVYRESMGMDDQLEKMVRQFYRHMAQVEADNIRLGMELGMFRQDVDPLLVAYAHIGMVERVLLQWQFDRRFPDIPDLQSQLIKLAFVGIRERSS